MMFRFKKGDKVIPAEGCWRDGSKYKIVEKYCMYTDTLYIQGIRGFEKGFEYKKINENGEVVMGLTMENLEECFKGAIAEDADYIGVKIQMSGFEKPEIIINEKENFKSKLEYYKKSYNEDLTLKSFNGIKIIGFTFADTFEDIKWDLYID